MPAKTSSRTDETDRKINLIPSLITEVARLNQLIVTGNVLEGEPGLLEDVRNIRKDIKDIKTSQGRTDSLKDAVDSLDRRVTAIEQRHTQEDNDRKYKKEKVDKVTIALIIFAATQLAEMVISWFHLR